MSPCHATSNLRSATQPLRQVSRRLLLGGPELQGAEMLELGRNHMVASSKRFPSCGKIHMFNGKIHYFYGHLPVRYVKLPEGKW